MSGLNDSCNQDFNQSVEPTTENINNNKTLVEQEQPTLTYDMDGADAEEVKRGHAYERHAQEWMEHKVPETQIAPEKPVQQSFNEAAMQEEQTQGGWFSNKNKEQEQTQGGWFSNKNKEQEQTQGGWFSNHDKEQDQEREL